MVFQDLHVQEKLGPYCWKTISKKTHQCHVFTLLGFGWKLPAIEKGTLGSTKKLKKWRCNTFSAINSLKHHQTLIEWIIVRRGNI